MSTSPMPVAAQVGGLKAQLRERYRALAPRERLLVAVAAGVLLFYAVWSVAVQPALRTVREAPATLETLEAQLQDIQRLAGESRALRNATPVSAAQAGAALRVATERLGGAGRIALLSDRATLTLTQVHGDALQSWLGEARTAARARVVDAQLTRNAQGYSGSIVVTFGAAR